MSEFIKISEAAKILNVHHMTIRRMIKDGRLKALNMGHGAKRKSYRIYHKEFERFMAEEYENGKIGEKKSK